MPNPKITKRDAKSDKSDEGKTGSKQLTLAEAMASEATATAAASTSPRGESETDSTVLMELRKFRQENATAFRDMKESFTRIETKMKELANQTEGLDNRVTGAEHRLSSAEDGQRRHERVLSYLLRRELELTNRCEDIENRLRRNNIRIYGIPEGAERDNMLIFVSDFLKGALKMEERLDIRLERAHRAIGPKPRDTQPPRSIIVRFLDFRVKQAVLQQAWKQRNVQFEGHNIFFDQDYSPELQRKRKNVREVIKQLKEKNIKAQSPYPAKLRIFLASGTKVFSNLLEAQSTLEELGVTLSMDERDMLDMELSHNAWSVPTRSRRRMHQLTTSEIRGFILEKEQLSGTGSE